MSRGARPRTTFADLERAAAAVPPVDDRLVHQVPIAAIRTSGRNPRAALPALDELAASLREHGLLQPVVVRRRDVGYELIAGHRRLEAWQSLGNTEIPAVVRQESDDRAYVLMLVENLQRENLEPQEEAAALQALQVQLGSLGAVADAIKRSKGYVSKRIRVYQDAALAAAVLDGTLAPTTAEELLPVRDPEARQALVQQAQAEAWDAPTARAAVRDRFESKQPPGIANGATEGFESKQAGRARARSHAVTRHAQELRRALEAGPLDELSADALDAIHALASYLAGRVPRLPL